MHDVAYLKRVDPVIQFAHTQHIPAYILAPVALPQALNLLKTAEMRCEHLMVFLAAD